MPAHNRRNMFLDEIFEWNHFAGHKCFIVDVDNRQFSVRIQARVAVPGVMLRRRNHACRLRSRRIRSAQNARKIRIFAERTRTNHRGLQIGVQIHRGSKIHIDTQHAKFPRNIKPCLPRIFGSSACADCEVSGRIAHFAFDVPNPAAFLVGRHKKRNAQIAFLASLLQFGYAAGDLVNIVGVPAKNLD